jgi:Protein of unknown function (DUF1460)
MKHAQPRGLSRRRVQSLLSRTNSQRSAGSRIDVLSRLFLGHSYNDNCLIGSAETPEVFTASLDGFDCVTYIETVLALARASSPDDFIKSLRKIRYAQGRVAWARRNHYMTAWIRNNTREGFVRSVAMPSASVLSRLRTLTVVPGLSARRTRVKCLPKSALPKVAGRLQTGDLMFFVSTRKNLDVFHTGIVIREGKRLLLRHAARSRGSVVEQDLNEFLKANRMAGVIVVRPDEVRQ